jgi:hypothetical protein
MQDVIGLLATRSRKTFAEVRSLPLADALKILDDAAPADDRQEAGTKHKPGGKAAGPMSRRPGRPIDTDPDRDRRIAEAWRTGPYRTYDDLARALKMPGGHDVEAAIDRDRKRRKNPE